jgi:hypothetical protein
MLGWNGRTPPSAPQPPPQPQLPQPDAEFDFNPDNSQFDEWDEVIEDEEAEAAEEAS